MSIQLVVCTPWYYLDDKELSDYFVKSVFSETKCELDNSDKNISHTIDLPISVSFEMGELAFEHWGDCLDSDILVAVPVILPCRFDGLMTVEYSEDPDEEADVLVSHATFISALSRFKKLFERIVKDFEKSDDFYYLINAYEEAIELSLKHNLIIYLDT